MSCYDSGDKLLTTLMRSHACIPVTPTGKKLSFPQDLINPTSQLAVLYCKGTSQPDNAELTSQDSFKTVIFT